MQIKKFTYLFKQGKAEGSAKDKNLLGGKGANLAEMCNLGLPVPPGVTIPTEVCVYHMEDDDKAKQALVKGLAKKVTTAFDTEIKPDFGYMPLMSVRSGSRVSMPGMMDTVLNVGLTPDTLPHWIEKLGAKAALDSYRRLIQMYANVVHDIPAEVFEELAEKGSSPDSAVQGYLKLYEEILDQPFPDTLDEQLHGAIDAVFKSWNGKRAVAYRNAHNIPHTWGTAVNVQAMVFGNANENSGSGVLFSRNPQTGEPGLYGEYLVNAQGEDVVAGIRTPEPISEMIQISQAWIDAHDELVKYAAQMELHYKDMQDMEFTIEDGKLWILQTRTGKRSAKAAFRIAYDMEKSGLITKEDAIRRVTGKQYIVLQKPTIDPFFTKKPDITGIPAAGHIVSGTAVFSSAEAKKYTGNCILVAKETAPDDFEGMLASVGILTVTGGATSHAAVVARGMNKTCVVGCTDLKLGKTIKGGDYVTLDGETGRVWVNAEVPVQTSTIEPHVDEIVTWALGHTDANVLEKITPVLSDLKSWEDEFGAQLPESGNICIDLSSIVEEIPANLQKSRVLTALFRVLRLRPELGGLISFKTEGVSEKDVEFLNFFGVSEIQVGDTSNLTKQISACEMKVLNKKFKNRWVLHFPVLTKEESSRLDAVGWRQVKTVRTLGDLLNIDGMVELDVLFAEKMKKENASLEEFIALLKAAGRKVEPLPERVSKLKIVFEALGKS